MLNESFNFNHWWEETPTWVTIRLYAEFSLPTRGWEGVSLKLWSCEASRWGFSWDPKPGWSLISWAQGRTMAATQSSTWRCRKLFHVYLKNKFWKEKKNNIELQPSSLSVELWKQSSHQEQIYRIETTQFLRYDGMAWRTGIQQGSHQSSYVQACVPKRFLQHTQCSQHGISLKIHQR